MNEIKMLTIVTGEMVITEIEQMLDDAFVVNVPLTVVPIPVGEGNSQQQIGFTKALPFSDYSKRIKINKANVISISTPEKQLISTYEDFMKKFKAQQAGIITPTAQEASEILNKKKIDFSQLNIGR